MKKRTLALGLALSLLLTACGGAQTTDSGTQSTGTQSDSTQSETQAETQAESTAQVSAQSSGAVSGEYFSESDMKDVSGETANADITLEGDSGTLSDTTRGSSGSTVTITSKGIYRVTGQSDGVTILVNESNKSGTVYLVLDNVQMTNEDACIQVEAADKVVVQCVGNCTLESTNPEDAAIVSQDDLTLNGSGVLSIVSGKHGVVSKDDLKLYGLEVNIEAERAGLKANDSVCLDAGSWSILSGRDGIQVDSDEGSGYFCILSGTLDITAGYDGIDVGSSTAEDYSGFLLLSGGAVTIEAGGGSGQSKGDTSQKGVRCDGDIYLENTVLDISSADDAVHSGGSVVVTGGAAALSTSDDGVSAAAQLSISAGALSVSKSYEGLEAEEVVISGGTLEVYASDDGINAAGGSDSSSTEQGPWSQGSLSGTITISGGTVYVNADGDGIDSNGSIYVSGGTVLVEGPTNSGNGALDKGDGADCVLSITGGTVLALGSAGMAENFSAGTQCSALVALSGQAGDTVSVDDGFTFTASKQFDCVVYSSPTLQEGGSYTITAGESSAVLDFTDSLYYSDVSSAMGGQVNGMGGRGGQMLGADGEQPEMGERPDMAGNAFPGNASGAEG